MKKTVLLVLALAAFFVLPNASVWEGSGTVAPSGSLPDEGYYAATNSFPRNTVVDITNLETGKSIRVIVASGLDTPGLLAVISRDAALSIGLQSRSIGRIRMIQPSDPIAFSRFTEGLSSSGDPDYDPSTLLKQELPPEKETEIAEETAAEKTAPEESVSDTEESAAEEGAPAVIAGTPSPAEEETEAADGVPSPAGEDADRNSPVASEIVDVPESPSGETGEAAEDGSGLFLAAPVPEKEEENPEETAETPVEISETGSENPEESVGTPVETSEAEPESPVESVGIPVKISEAEPESPADAAGESAYNSVSLVPAESRPPQDEAVWSLPPEAEVAPIGEHDTESSFAMAEAAPLPEETAPSSDYMDESLIADPLRTHQEETPPQALMDEYLFVDSVKPQQAEAPHAVDGDDFVPSSQPAAAAPESFNSPEAPHNFSVPLVASLEKGKYYLQLGAFSRPESVESAIAAIDRTYPLAVQSGGNSEKPLYRILVGPLNLGESGAALQRFKGSGYKDAFVRKIGD
ncbi:MAG: SPOR domain-containing protein [Treponema sp.]|jgi:hypothetical protein|nr:SPOR domain-containing protein [Treponema sp.]